jgi:hypothetical protein
MPRLFNKHYTRAEAQALLPLVRLWLKRIFQLCKELQKAEERVNKIMKSGCDVGGPLVNSWLRTQADLKDVMLEFQRREIQIKDLDRGLLDFPAIVDGKEVFLCWEDGEEDIEFWHDIDTGYAGRQRLDA